MSFYNLSDCTDVLRTVSNGRVGVEPVNFAVVDNMSYIKFNSFYSNTDRRYNLWLRGNPNYNMNFYLENCHQDMFRKILFTDVNRLILQDFEIHAPKLKVLGLIQ